MAFKKTLEKEAKGEEPDIAVPKFKQRKGESDVAYVPCMEQEAQHVLFLSKNQAPRQPEVQSAPKKSERKKAFQKRRLEKAQRKREARAVDRLEQELLKGSSSRSRRGSCGPHRAGPGLPTIPLGGPYGLPGSPPLVGQWMSEF